MDSGLAEHIKMLIHGSNSLVDKIQTHEHDQSDTNSWETWTLIGPLWIETWVQIQTLICLFEFENMPIADKKIFL